MRTRFCVFQLIVLALLMASCSPKDKAEAMAEKYCLMLSEGEELAEPVAFVAHLQLTDETFADELAQQESRYAISPKKQAEFRATYQAIVDSARAVFCAKCDSLTRARLTSCVWYMVEDKSRLCLYSFSDSLLTIHNCRPQFGYRLAMDTLVVADSLRALIRFAGADSLMLVSMSDAEMASCFRPATPKELIVGMWRTGREGKMGWMEYAEDGRYYGMEAHCFSGTYELTRQENDAYRLTLDEGEEGLQGDVEFRDADHFTVYGETHVRTKKPYLSSLNVLFNK